MACEFPLGIALGADELMYASLETVCYGTWQRPVGTDALRVKEITFGRSQERVTRDDKLGTRSHTERISRKKTVEWSFRSYLVPSGIDPSVAATPPDIGDVFAALFGVETINAGQDVTYSLLRQNVLSLTLHRIGVNYAESLTGCVPNAATISWSGTEEPEIEVSGFGKNWVITVKGETASATTVTGTTVKVIGAANVCNVDSMIAIDDAGTIDDNGGLGYHVSAVVDFDPITITAGSNDDIDFTDDDGTFVATVSDNGGNPYTTPESLALAIKTALEATATTQVYTVTYSEVTNLFTITGTGTLLTMPWITGPNNATSIASTIGFTADDSGSPATTGYTGDAPITGSITIDDVGGFDNANASGSTVIPFFPAAVVQGSPATSLLGGVTLGGVNFRTTEGSIEFSNNLETRNDFYGYEDAQGFSISGRREVTVSFTVYLEDAVGPFVQRTNRFDELQEVLIQLGTAAGNILKINIPYLELDNVPFTVPEQAEGTVEFTGMALDPVAPFEGEINLVFE
jgi:hypothetical protein